MEGMKGERKEEREGRERELIKGENYHVQCGTC